MTITHRASPVTSTQRDAWIEINLSALERNYKKLNDLLKTKIIAVVKADAYGHGALALAPVLQSLGVDSFGVATVDEGIALRKSGIKVPIIILGATPFWAYESCSVNQLTITIYSEEQIAQLESLGKTTNLKIPVQLKIDTGMNRLGIDYKGVKKIIDLILNSKFLELKGIFSHLSDSANYEFSKVQKERFELALGNCKELKVQKHIANSFAAINYPEFKYDLVRVGIALFGQGFNFLEPLITLKGRIIQIHNVLKGESVSYERTWTAQKDSIIATVPIGYADGIDRNLSNKISAIYKDAEIKQVGTITMDQMMFDITDIKSSQINDVITLLGNEIKIESWAKVLGGISYELLCRLKIRLPRVYTRDL